jgi:hypothetical protein
MKLIRLVLPVACAVSVAACTSTQQVAASKERLNSTARSIVGTSLIGARGKTVVDQDKIDDTIAGLCGSRTFIRDECARHDEAVK